MNIQQNSILANKTAIITHIYAVFLILGLLLGIDTAQAATITVSPPKHEFELQKGQTVQAEIFITNGDASDLLVSPSVADFTAEGEAGHAAFVEQSEDVSSFSLASWVQLPEAIITIPAGEKVVVPFTISVPEHAEAGGHFGTIFFSPVTPGGGAIALQQKVGVLLLVRVAGDVHEQGELARFDSFSPALSEDAIADASSNRFFGSFPVSFAIRFTNTGNVHTKPRGSIKLYNMFGAELQRVGKEIQATPTGAVSGTKIVDYVPVNDGNGNVLPNSSRVFLAPWNGYAQYKLTQSGDKETVWKGIGFGRYRAELNLSYGDSVFPTQIVYFWIIPWKLIIPTLLALMALIFGIRFWNKKSRERIKEELRNELINNS